MRKRAFSLRDLGNKERGYYYALPGLILGIFHMIVAYAITAADGKFRNGDFLPGLMEGVIGIALYGGLFCCVIMAIAKRKPSAVLEFIGIVTAGRLLLPVFGMIGGGVVITVVIVGVALIFISGAITLVGGAILGPIIGMFTASSLTVIGLLKFIFPVMGVIVIITMVVGALTGAFAGAGFLGSLFTKLIPLL